MGDLSLKQFVDMDAPACAELRRGAGGLRRHRRDAGAEGARARARRIRAGPEPPRRRLRLRAQDPRLARPRRPRTTVAAIDKSADFIADADRRAAAAGLRSTSASATRSAALPGRELRLRPGGAAADLPRDPAGAREMRPVARPGAGLALIEPDFSTTTLNLPDRPAAAPGAGARGRHRRPRQSWLPGPLLGSARRPRPGGRAGRGCSLSSQDLGARYFTGVGQPRRRRRRPRRRRSTPLEWRDRGAAGPQGRLFGTVGYFLFTADTPP